MAKKTTKPVHLRSRFLNELTTPEVDAYLRSGGDIALLPVGCVEMHGPHQPIGTDNFIAKAFALELAKRGNGLVLPEIHYTWAGSTDGFAGTVSIEPELVMVLVESIALKCLKMGFNRFYIVSIHGGNAMPIGLVVRRFFEKYQTPIVMINPYDPLSAEAKALFSGGKTDGREASLVLAALHLLGQGDLYTQEQMAYEEHFPKPPQSYQNLRPALVGKYMQDMRQHACPSPQVSREKGLKFFELQLAKLVPAIFDNLAQYRRDVARQKNKGYC